jgi:hypothetical protein
MPLSHTAVVHLRGLEPPTTRLRGPVLCPLSYRCLVTDAGLEPAMLAQPVYSRPPCHLGSLRRGVGNEGRTRIPGATVQCSAVELYRPWAQKGSNRRPPGCGPGALPLSYAPLRALGGTRTPATWLRRPLLLSTELLVHVLAWSLRELNPGPPPCQGGALPLS